MTTDVYRDGKIHVCARMCSTCIFRPGNLLDLPESRVPQMVADATANDGCIPCHHTTYGQAESGEAVCRGFYERHPTPTLRLAAAMRVIQFQEPEL